MYIYARYVSHLSNLKKLQTLYRSWISAAVGYIDTHIHVGLQEVKNTQKLRVLCVHILAQYGSIALLLVA